MDAGLLSWARAVKQRRRRGRLGAQPPVLWLFTDAARLPDPLPAIAALPKGLCGVVFRHDGMPGRLSLALQVARLCKKRRLPLVVAGDARLAARVKAGVHLRGGFWPSQLRIPAIVTSSAHDTPELRRARRAGAAAIFLSPMFATASHSGGRPLGPLKWALIARRSGGSKIYSLGGITGGNAAGLPPACAGAGAISALIPSITDMSHSCG